MMFAMLMQGIGLLLHKKLADVEAIDELSHPYSTLSSLPSGVNMPGLANSGKFSGTGWCLLFVPIRCLALAHRIYLLNECAVRYLKLFCRPSI
jgi:hypothetical protein